MARQKKILSFHGSQNRSSVIIKQEFEAGIISTTSLGEDFWGLVEQVPRNKILFQMVVRTDDVVDSPLGRALCCRTTTKYIRTILVIVACTNMFRKEVKKVVVVVQKRSREEGVEEGKSSVIESY